MSAGIVGVLFYAAEADARNAKDGLSEALAEHRKWSRNDRPETIEVSDGIGSHTYALATMVGISLTNAALLHRHDLASQLANAKALGAAPASPADASLKAPDEPK